MHSGFYMLNLWTSTTYEIAQPIRACKWKTTSCNHQLRDSSIPPHSTALIFLAASIEHNHKRTGKKMQSKITFLVGIEHNFIGKIYCFIVVLFILFFFLLALLVCHPHKPALDSSTKGIFLFTLLVAALAPP